MRKCTDKRKEFVQEVINEPEKALKELEEKIKSAKHCRNSSDRIYFLSELLFLSTRTIERDLTT